MGCLSSGKARIKSCGYLRQQDLSVTLVTRFMLLLGKKKSSPVKTLKLSVWNPSEIVFLSVWFFCISFLLFCFLIKEANIEKAGSRRHLKIDS